MASKIRVVFGHTGQGDIRPRLWIDDAADCGTGPERVARIGKHPVRLLFATIRCRGRSGYVLRPPRLFAVRMRATTARSYATRTRRSTKTAWES